MRIFHIHRKGRDGSLHLAEPGIFFGLPLSIDLSTRGGLVCHIP
jgi:hypothetical protein